MDASTPALPSAPAGVDGALVSPSGRARALRWLLRAIGAAVLFVGLIGLAHTPLGKPLLGLLRAAGGCPVGAKLEPEARDRARAIALASVRGDRPAAGQPRVGPFELVAATKPEVLGWSARTGSTCVEAEGGAGLRCVPGASSELGLEPVPESVLFLFDQHGRTTALDVSWSKLSPEAAVALVERLSAELERVVGPATRSTGELRPATLAAMLGRVEREHRYSDARAQVLATRVAEGVRVSQKLQHIPAAL